MGLKSPEAPAYITRSVRVSSWVTTGASSPSFMSSKNSLPSATDGSPSSTVVPDDRVMFRGSMRPEAGSPEDQVGDAVVVPGGGAEEVLGGVRAPDVQVQVVLPRVPDSAVDLHAVLRTVRRSPSRCGLGDVGSAVLLRIVGVDAHRRVVHGAPGTLEVERAVGELVLDGLEASDRHVELHALLGV